MNKENIKTTDWLTRGIPKEQLKQEKQEARKKLFCKHKTNEVVCWHWTHGYNTNEIRFLEIQLKCSDCGKYHFAEIRDWDECYKFIARHEDKMWSPTCKPVGAYIVEIED